ncbi:MAG TPA: hypothetical protein VF234_07300, partial [Limnochordia bacterium]
MARSDRASELYRLLEHSRQLATGLAEIDQPVRCPLPMRSQERSQGVQQIDMPLETFTHVASTFSPAC